MRVLFDLLHPAHFHLFRHVIAELLAAGNKVEIIAREKDCLPELLAQTDWPVHLIRRKKPSSLTVLAKETLQAAWLALRLAQTKHIDIMAGTSISIGPAARATGAKSIMFVEDDAKIVPIYAKLGYPIAHYVATPACLGFEDSSAKRLTYPGYHELAYLHPNRFEPDPQIREALGVGPDERYFLVRLVSLTAHHDIGESGLSTTQARQIVDRLSQHGRVFISAESTVDASLQQYLLPTPTDRIFDVLAFADIVVGDSQTMTIEAAVLGTPSLRCNTFVGRLTVPAELEERYGLTFGFVPQNCHKLLSMLDFWLAQADLKEQWRQKREAMLAESVDVTEWILDTFYRL
jgi:predicted glycosyltransferase